MGISLLPSAGFGPAVRWDLKVNKFLWRLQPSKFLPFFFSCIINAGILRNGSRTDYVNLIVGTTQAETMLTSEQFKNVFPISLAL